MWRQPRTQNGSLRKTQREGVDVFKGDWDEDGSTKDEQSVLSGTVPVFINARGSVAEGEPVAETLGGWIQRDGVAPDTVAVLVRSESQIKLAEVLSTATFLHGYSRVERAWTRATCQCRRCNPRKAWKSRVRWSWGSARLGCRRAGVMTDFLGPSCKMLS